MSNDFLELLLFGTPRYGSHRNTCRYERNKTTEKIGDQVLRLLSPQLTLRNKYIYSMEVVNLVENKYRNMLV